MKVEIRELKRKDYKKAIQFAISGMHFNWYLDSKLLLNLYGRYFWYSEITRATHVLAGYAGERLAGVLLAEMDGEKKKYKSFFMFLYVKVFDIILDIFCKKSAGLYDETMKEMISEYKKMNSPDGKIIFLAADPDALNKGIGTALLAAFEQQEPGKKIYLQTNNACTYQFYEHRGFERARERDIVLDIRNRRIQLKCFIYAKTTGS